MLGHIRFFLALAVMLSHYPGAQLKFNIGVMAVIGFYTISGYLMHKSYQRFQQRSATPLRAFYIDRAFKLLPIYLILVLSSFAIVNLGQPVAGLQVLNQPWELDRLFFNLALLPVNYVFDPFTLQSVLPHPIIPPAWSLATEFHYYLLLPLLFLLPQPALIAIFSISFLLQLISVSGWTHWPADSLGYRYLPGVLLFFLFGHLLANTTQSTRPTITKNRLLFLWLAIWLAAWIGFGPVATWGQVAWQQEVWIAALLLPLLHPFLKKATNRRWQHTQPPNRLKTDRFLGNLAYPLFLSHFVCFYATGQFLPLTSPGAWWAGLVMALLLSTLLARMQTTLDRYRIHYRGFQSLRTRPTP
ncbi:acyltransferase family protein [Hydrogenovibrio halophilus]|uniref:acyltransferase family protein n=1 Tax=Hydrogenovibrio halophilus TaxID=373391 RepID=UPI00036F4C5A|nr:acyltransferase [Hydrogenovibrio halophilus]